MTPKTIPEIVDLASAFYGSAVLFAALDLGVFKALAEQGGSADRDALARELGASPRGLGLLLDACVASGLLGKDEDTYFNTDAGKLALVPGGPADLSKAIRYNQDVYPAWGRLADLARTGRPVERPELHLGDDPDRSRSGAAWCRCSTSRAARAFSTSRAGPAPTRSSSCARTRGSAA